MASDAAKKTTISIAEAEGSKLAKSIGEDLTADDTKEAADKVAVEKAATDKAAADKIAADKADAQYVLGLCEVGQLRRSPK